MTSKTTNKSAPEVRERAERMVLDHERDRPIRRPLRARPTCKTPIASVIEIQR